TPPKDGEEAASSSDSASDAASSLFNHWGRDLGPESRRVALKKFRYFGYNGYLSDRISLTRPIPDLRPDGCRNMSYSSDLPQLSVIFIFVNEALSVLLRSIHTVIQRTPSYLLKEIILVDDNSNSCALHPSGLCQNIDSSSVYMSGIFFPCPHLISLLRPRFSALYSPALSCRHQTSAKLLISGHQPRLCALTSEFYQALE
ncbi:hypothetical protein ATANTOWER_014417, partial [Ataeniobius toweri]|nr:hypothetical protein [Ataeniobius toweri]